MTKLIITKSIEVGEFLQRPARLESAQDRRCLSRSHKVLQVDGQGHVDSSRDVREDLLLPTASSYYIMSGITRPPDSDVQLEYVVFLSR